MTKHKTPGAVDAAAGADAAQSGRKTHHEDSKRNTLAKALQLVAAGIPVFPCNQDKSPRTASGFKDASCDRTQVERWWSCNPEALIGVPTGSKSGVWVLDADVDKVTRDPTGDATLARYDLSQYRHRCRTPSGGSHYFFRVTPELPRSSVKKIPGVDVRGEGGYIIAWNPDVLVAARHDPELEPPPVTLLAVLLNRASSSAGQVRGAGPTCANLLRPEIALQRELERVREAPEGTRRNTLNASAFQMGRTLSANCLLRMRVRDALVEAGLSTGLPESEVHKTIDLGLADGQRSSPPGSGIANSGELIRSAANTSDASKGEQLVTEDTVALAFALRYAGEFLYLSDRREWRYFEGSLWVTDERGLAYDRMRTLARQMAHQCPTERTATLRSVGRESFVSGALRLVRTDPVFASLSTEFDADQWLLGTPEGVVDLHTGLLRQGRPEDRISKCTGVTPTDQADCPLFERFLYETTGGNQEVIRFLKQWFGYCLTGSIAEQALLCIYGPGGNGKSVLISAVTEIFGGYATTAPMDTFSASKFERHPTHLARLSGSRLVTGSETESDKTWAEALLKQITGGDHIAARFMHQDYFTYKPQLKLTFTGNHEPALKNVDDAIKRRFNIIHFNRRPKTPDNQLLDKLRLEYPAILRWLIDGCLDWQTNALVRPAAVTLATDQYFDAQDLIGQWLEAECVVTIGDQNRWTPHRELYAAWKAFAEAAGEDPGTGKAFTGMLRHKGLTPGKKSFGGIIRFVTLRKTYPAPKEGRI